MSLGSNLHEARKKKGLSQETVADKLNVSRQTISKWETDETIPDLLQSKRLAALYGIKLDELSIFDPEVEELIRVVENTSQKTVEKVDWNKVWSKQYPILAQYKAIVKVDDYNGHLEKMLDQLSEEYGLNELDAFLVLKDILAGIWFARHPKKGKKKTGAVRSGRQSDQ